MWYKQYSNVLAEDMTRASVNVAESFPLQQNYGSYKMTKENIIFSTVLYRVIMVKLHERINPYIYERV